jgi:seryl-tRNA synthetase
MFCFNISLISASELFQEESKGCKISLDSTIKHNCSKKKKESETISIAPIVIPKKEKDDNKRIDKLEEALRKITKEFSAYKRRREKKIDRLSIKLNHVSKEFKRYRQEKERRLKKINHELVMVKRELSLNKKKLNSIKKSVKVKKKKKQKKKVKTIKKSLNKKKPHQNKKLNIDSSLLPPNTPWVDVVVEDGLNIYQLSMRYYKKRENYKLIYLANKDVIDSDLKVYNGMSLRIPIIDTFEEQPIFLNRSY